MSLKISMGLSSELVRVVSTVSAVILANNVLSTTFNCNSELACEGGVCADNENCNLLCTAYRSCYYGDFNCQTDGISNCSVIANASESMVRASIYGKQSSKLSITVTGNVSKPFEYASVSCPTNGFCDVNVYTDQCCHWSSITADTNGTIEVYSSGNRSFTNGRIDARDGLSLKLMSDVMEYSFSDTTIYCPTHNNLNDGNYSYWCVLLGISGSTYENSDIYAINGLKDILFGEYEIDINDNVILHCDDDYSKSCQLYYDNITQAIRCNETFLNQIYCEYGKFSQC